MNQEKLAKLQAQVRIGGKVSATIKGVCFGWSLRNKCFFFIVGAFIFTGVCPQKEEGGSQNGFSRRQKTSVLPKETWSQQHFWH